MSGSNKRALVVYGGWEGHRPAAMAQLFQEMLQPHGFEVLLSDSLDSLGDRELLAACRLVVPMWTMGRITSEQVQALCEAVEGGVGLAGCHGGMCDAFRESTAYHFLTGGQWVAHPGNDGVEYEVRITDPEHPITAGLPDFPVKSEQYYLHTDPSNHVLAVTRFPVAEGPHTPNGPFDMPVAWTRMHGRGRVFYCALGHTPEVIAQPPARTLVERGVLWSAG